MPAEEGVGPMWAEGGDGGQQTVESLLWVSHNIYAFNIVSSIFSAKSVVPHSLNYPLLDHNLI
jgi:hypothetical protein